MSVSCANHREQKPLSEVKISEKDHARNLGIAGAVAGLVAIAFCWFPIVAIIFCAIASVLLISSMIKNACDIAKQESKVRELAQNVPRPTWEVTLAARDRSVAFLGGFSRYNFNY